MLNLDAFLSKTERDARDAFSAKLDRILLIAFGVPLIAKFTGVHVSTLSLIVWAILMFCWWCAEIKRYDADMRR